MLDPFRHNCQLASPLKFSISSPNILTFFIYNPHFSTKIKLNSNPFEEFSWPNLRRPLTPSDNHYILFYRSQDISVLLQVFLIHFVCMGNYITCTLAGPTGGKNSSKDTVTVIFPGRDVRRFHEPTKAAELMFDMPNFFVVTAKSFQIGERLTALSADQDLEMGNVYVLFPMKRLNSAVKAADMAALVLTASRESKRVPFGSVKVTPECGLDSPAAENGGNHSVPRMNLEDMEEYSMPEFRHRMSMCRSKKPMLETIVEEHFSLRFVMMMEN